jgi:glycerol-3-phosphate dehydrogenase (NAD(P)+)
MGGVAVLGTGAWGTTLAILVARERERRAHEPRGEQKSTVSERISLWEHRPERAVAMERERENAIYLPGYPFPASLRVTSDLAEAVAVCDLILFVTPSQRVREHARSLAPLLTQGTVVICCSKGLELGTKLRMSQALREELPAVTRIGALSGPNLAAEVARGLPAAAVVASADRAAAEMARAALNSARFRVYSSDDVVGVELGGALKNVIAIGIGVSDGLGYGDNAKASFMTRGLAEIARLALAAGANPLTLAGLAGLGDLIATCSSPLSRNRTLGLELAKGRSLDDVLAERNTVAEGAPTTRAALELARDLGVEMPITEQIFQVLYEGKDVRKAVQSLMLRDPKHELEGLGGVP